MAPASVEPAISVITPAKNRLQLLSGTIDSAQSQTVQDCGQMIVDDGSDDTTANEIIRRAAGPELRIRYIARMAERVGPMSAAISARARAGADLVVMLDSDSLLRP